MEEAVVGSVLGATIRVVIKNVLLTPTEEFNLVRDFKKDLKRLNNSLLMIQDFLYDAEMQQITNKALNRWLKKLESLAFEADNLFYELNYLDLRSKMETQDNITKKVQAFFTRPNFHRNMARKIRDINEKLKLINQEATDFGLQIMKPVGTAGFDAIGWGTDPYAADPIVLGREDDVSRIVEMLTTSSTQQVFLILLFVGMGGLGNATATRGDLLKKLQQQLSTKRYLLVLDDLWNERRERWDDFLNSLSGIRSVMGNGMIVTTRGGNAASIVKKLPIYKLKRLSEDKCWSIIKAKAFREGEVPPELEIIGRNIAKRCQGLPLVSKVAGGLLCDKPKDEWLAIEETWLSNFGEDENAILKVLKFSFDHLSSPSFKKCFAYCSIFPKGFNPNKELLIELWIAEGFLPTDQGNDMEIVAKNFFNLLVQNSLLQVVARDSYGDLTYCNMPDLVHDLASSLLSSKIIV